MRAFFIALVALLVSGVAFAQDEACSIAVLRLNASAGISTSEVKSLTDVVAQTLSEMSECSVLSTNDISQMIEFEAQRLAAGCDDSGCLSELADALGVDKMVSGELSKVQGRRLISLRIASLTTMKIEGRATESASRGTDMVAMVQYTTRQLLTDDPRRIGPRPREGALLTSVNSIWRNMAWGGVATTSAIALLGGGLAIATTTMNGLLPGLKSARNPDVDAIKSIEDAGPLTASGANLAIYLGAASALCTVALFFFPANEEVIEGE